MNATSIMLIDDHKSHLFSTEKILKRKFPECSLYSTQYPHCVFTTMAFKDPDILVIDYEYPHYCLMDEEKIIDRLIHFKGLVIVYSGHEIRDIEDCFLDKFGHIPKNFRICNKRNPLSLIKEIIHYESRKDNDIKYPANRE